MRARDRYKIEDDVRFLQQFRGDNANKGSERHQERQKYYQNPMWVKLRNAYIKEHPLCQRCLLMNRVTPSRDCHHLVSFMKGKTETEKLVLLLNENNIVALCRDCHNLVHGNVKENDKDNKKNK